MSCAATNFVDPTKRVRPRTWRVDVTRRKFSRQFKIETVKLVTDRCVAVAQTACDLAVAEGVLRRWLLDAMRELTATPAMAFSGHGQMLADLAEIAALKKEVGCLSAKHDILKKAAFFAREAT